jgi:Flp pilus assembly protein TadB
VWGVAFTGAWLVVPVAWAYVRETAHAAAEGFGRERVAVGTRVVLFAIAGVALCAGIAVQTLTGSVAAALIAGAVGLMVPPGGRCRVIRPGGGRRFQEQFMDVLLMIANSLSAGFNLSQAIDIVAREMPAPGPRRIRARRPGP